MTVEELAMDEAVAVLAVLEPKKLDPKKAATVALEACGNAASAQTPASLGCRRREHSACD